MRQKSTGSIEFFEFETLDAGRVVQAVFTRQGGVSLAPYESLNMSVSTGDDPANVRANRTRAFDLLGCDPASVADLWQVHSADVVEASEPNDERSHLGQADALITDRPGVTLFLRFADCVPIVLYDPRRPAVGLVHAGWRGTLLGAAPAAVRAMHERYGSRPQDILAGVGPSIGPCHYGVGPEVVEQTRAVFPGADELLPRLNGGHALDLWAANALALRRAGVDQVEVSGLCTACHNDLFFSHRADGARTGRFGALLALR
jgi:YfiH family protein